MSTPEIPDFSAVPPSQQPAPPATDQVEQTPRRGGRGLAVAGLATALVIGTVGTAAFVTGRGGGSDDVRLASAQTALGEQPGDGDGPGVGHDGWGKGPGGRHGGPGGFGLMGPRGALHGELVVPQRDGTGTQTVVVQTGEVTAVSAKSLSLKSTDGYTATYVITSTTRVGARSAGITSLKKGDTVSVLATKSGSTLTAVMVGARPDGARPDGARPGTGPRQRGTAPAPSPSATGSSSDTSNSA
ncbi:MAG TPA: hypothetical protein VHO27_07360 [Angustibacter sp.]|nr:hypothetical protein [Angustibacter sp.]